MSSNEPNGTGGEEVSSGFVVACGDGAELFEFGEEVLDQVPGFVEFPVVRALLFATGFGRDDGLFACLLQRFQHSFVGIEALVGDHGSGFD